MSAPTASKIVRAYRDGGAGAVGLLCDGLPDASLREMIDALDGRAAAPWVRTKPGSRYARCGTCGEVHHYGLATTAHAAKHARERSARRILEGERFRRQEAASAPKRP